MGGRRFAPARQQGTMPCDRKERCDRQNVAIARMLPPDRSSVFQSQIQDLDSATASLTRNTSAFGSIGLLTKKWHPAIRA